MKNNHKPLFPSSQRLRFAPLAWLKLQLFLHGGECEVGGFAISAEDDLLYVEDFATVKQFVSMASVELEDAAVADYFDAAVDRGLPPHRFARLWIHTHPGQSATPSPTDEETFERVFGRCDWSVMFILSRSGSTYARLAFSAGPGAEIQLPVEVDWARWPPILIDNDGQFGDLFNEWMDEYGANIHPMPHEPVPPRIPIAHRPRIDAWLDSQIHQLGMMDQALFMEVGHD